MPVEQRSGTSQLTAIALGVIAVVVAVAAAWALLSLASGGNGAVKIQLGDEDFNAGQATRKAAQIRADGPILYSDVSGRGQRRPLFVNHFGDDPAQQWYVFSAIAPGAPEGCFLTWNAKRNLFDERRPDPDDPRKPGELCRDVTYSATGEGLQQYTWKLDSKNDLVIRIHPDKKSGDN